MQLMIDTDTSNPEVLRQTAEFILRLAVIRNPQMLEVPPDVVKAAAEKLPPPKDPAVLFAHNAPSVPAGTSVVIPPPPPPSVPNTATAPAIVSSVATAADTASTSPTPALVDKTGVAHDPKIHSEKPTLNVDGTWRARRGLGKVNPTLPASGAAPASTMAQEGVPTVTPITAGPPMTTISPSNVPPPPNNVVSLPLPNPVPPPPPVASSVLPGEGHGVMDFRAFMQLVQPLLASKQLPQDVLAAILATHDCANIGVLAAQPMLLPRIWTDIRAALGIY